MMQNKIKNNYTLDEQKLNQWLAGLIDGDGYLTIQKNNVAVCEITMPLDDQPLLEKIKYVLGGNIRPRNGYRAVRYRLSHQEGMKNLINRINGNIRNSIRIPQFKKICKRFNIEFIPVSSLTNKDGYTSGFFDADGSIYISVLKSSSENSTLIGVNGKIKRLAEARGYHQLGIEISNKYQENLIIFQKAFGFGNIRLINNGKKSFYIYKIPLANVQDFEEYIRKFPLHSVKRKRFFILKEYFYLKKIKAHLAEKDTIQNKRWVKFCKKWYL
jgi:ubiquinol-cytochrome c reductase cytochrome b subunit